MAQLQLASWPRVDAGIILTRTGPLEPEADVLTDGQNVAHSGTLATERQAVKVHAVICELPAGLNLTPGGVVRALMR